MSFFLAMETKPVEAPASSAPALKMELHYDDVSFGGMADELKAILVDEFGGRLEVETIPVPGGKLNDKVYRIVLGGEVYFDWLQPKPDDFSPKGGRPMVKKAPNAKWKKPINFDHVPRIFGSHEPFMVDELKAAIAAKL